MASYYERAWSHPIAGRWHRNIVNMIKTLLPQNFMEMKHLDLGCGDGLTIRSVKPEGEIIGADIDSDMLEFARKRNITTFHANVEDLSMFPSESFDLVSLIDTLEHVHHPVFVLSESYRVLRPKGFFVVVAPNVGVLFRLIWSLWTRFGMGKFWSRSPHLFEYSLWSPTISGLSLIERLRDVGFHPEKTAKTNLGMVAGVRAVKL